MDPHQQQPYQPHPYQQFQPQPPRPPKKKHTGLKVTAAVFGALIVIGGIASAVGGGDEDSKAEKKPATSSEAKAKAKPGKPAADDKAEAAAEADPESKPKSPKPAKPKAEPKPKGPKGYGDGDYIVGQDIPPGTYESRGANSDMFDFCAITTEPTGDTTMPQIKSANKGERIIITLAPKDGTITIQGCEPLTKR